MVFFFKLPYLYMDVAREELNLNRGVASACVHAGFLSLKLAWKSWSLCKPVLNIAKTCLFFVNYEAQKVSLRLSVEEFTTI